MNFDEHLKYFASLFNVEVAVLENGTLRYLNHSDNDLAFIMKNKDVKKILIDFPNHVYPYIVNINDKYSFALIYSDDIRVLVGPFQLKENLYIENSFSNVPIQSELSNIPAISLESNMALMLGLNYDMNHVKLQKDRFFIRNFINEKKDEILGSKITDLLYKNVELNRGHHNYDGVSNIERCIENGDTVLLLNAIEEKMNSNDTGILSNDPLRNAKDLFITGITIATRAAIKSKLHYEIAYSLSDTYIQEAEKAETIKEVKTLFTAAMLKIAELVKEVKQQNNTKSKENNIYIAQAEKYIFRHLTEMITVDDIADNIGISPNYLSSMFKKTQGISLTKYIQGEKIRIAKRLLLDSKMTQAEVASNLAFSSQSHFCGVFKEITGLTPKEYIKEALRLRQED